MCHRTGEPSSDRRLHRTDNATLCGTQPPRRGTSSSSETKERIGMDLTLAPAHTALVVIDLQRGIAGAPTAPHPASDVVAHATAVAVALRAAGGTVVLVHVTPSADGKDALHPQTDTPAWQPGPRPADWAEIVPELGPEPGDLVITKRQWGAFYGTELDLQLRRRGIDTILLAGISTNVGVESTARDAYRARLRAGVRGGRHGGPESRRAREHGPHASSRGSAGCARRPRCWPRSRWRLLVPWSRRKPQDNRTLRRSAARAPARRASLLPSPRLPKHMRSWPGQPIRPASGSNPGASRTRRPGCGRSPTACAECWTCGS